MRILRALLVMSVAGCLIGTSALPASAKAGDEELAKDAQLRRADLPEPDSWSLKPRSNNDAAADAIRKDIFECFQVRRVLNASKQYRAQGPNFDRTVDGGDQRINDTVYVFPSVKAARSFMSPFIDDDGVDCFRKYLLKAVQDTVKNSEVLVQSVERAPELGDSSIGYALTATITDDKNVEHLAYFDAYAIRVGRGVTALSIQS